MTEMPGTRLDVQLEPSVVAHNYVEFDTIVEYFVTLAVKIQKMLLLCCNLFV